jgi:hypothetical protein
MMQLDAFFILAVPYVRAIFLAAENARSGWNVVFIGASTGGIVM